MHLRVGGHILLPASLSNARKGGTWAAMPHLSQQQPRLEGETFFREMGREMLRELHETCKKGAIAPESCQNTGLSQKSLLHSFTPEF
ncbi:hypothetical protein L345_17768, partial [Ophiophagus hannah]